MRVFSNVLEALKMVCEIYKKSYKSHLILQRMFYLTFWYQGKKGEKRTRRTFTKNFGTSWKVEKENFFNLLQTAGH